MRITWEPSDIKGGRVSKKPDTQDKGTLVAWYGSGSDNSTEMALVSLDDGSIYCRGQTKQQIADWLNRNGDVPLYLVDLINK